MRHSNAVSWLAITGWCLTVGAEPVFAQDSTVADFPFVARWSNGESLLCDAPTTQGDQLKFDCRFGARSLPLARIRSLDLAGQAPVFAFDAFRRDNGDWQIQGKAQWAIDNAQGSKQCLALQAGTTLTRQFAPGCRAGTLAISFRESADPDYCRTSLTLAFGAGPGAVIRMEGDSQRGAFTLTPPAAGWRVASLSRSKLWRRLTVAFAPDRTVVAIDDVVLGEGSLPKSAELREMRLAVAPDAAAGDAPVCWLDDFSVVGAKAMAERYAQEPTQWDVLSNLGDQTFGELGDIDSRGVRLSVGAATALLPWPQVRSINFPVGKSRDATPGSQSGPLALLELPTGERLLGIVQYTTNRRATFTHALLGAIDLSAAEAQSLTLRPANRRIELFVGHRHLGAKLAASFRDPRPSGTTLSTQFNLPSRPTAAALTLWVAGMEGAGPEARFAEKLRAGHLQSQLFVNGKLAAALNDALVDQAKEMQELRIAVPADLLRSGDNVLELRQTNDPSTGNYDECEVADLALELKTD